MDNTQTDGQEPSVASTAVSVQQKVADEIKNCGPKVEQIVIDTLVNKEINTRQDILLKGLGRLKTLKKEFKAIDRNDSIMYVRGEKVESMSEARFKQIEKDGKAIKDLELAINKALEDNTTESYEKLNKLCAAGGDKKAE